MSQVISDLRAMSPRCKPMKSTDIHLAHPTDDYYAVLIDGHEVELKVVSGNAHPQTVCIIRSTGISPPFLQSLMIAIWTEIYETFGEKEITFVMDATNFVPLPIGSVLQIVQSRLHSLLFHSCMINMPKLNRPILNVARRLSIVQNGRETMSLPKNEQEAREMLSTLGVDPKYATEVYEGGMPEVRRIHDARRIINNLGQNVSTAAAMSRIAGLEGRAERENIVAFLNNERIN